MLIESLHERLKWLKTNCYQESDHQLVIEEPKQDGYAKIDCEMQGYAIAFSIEKDRFGLFQNGRCADAIIFQKNSDDSWQLHIIECKKTVRKDDWSKTKEQFEGAVLNAYALIGILGIGPISRIKCYTAFRNDRLSIAANTDPSTLKAPLGICPKKEIQCFDWEKDLIDILSVKNVEHRKIQLDQLSGEGHVVL